MKVAVIGVGKLGLCWALLCQRAGHDVVGYDANPDAVAARMADPSNGGEQGLGKLLEEHGPIRLVDMAEVGAADVVYICVQTPHDDAYSGELPMPPVPADFDYSHLTGAVATYAEAMYGKPARDDPRPTLVIMSTVLPGTIDREIRPLLERIPVRLVYSPAFISLGTTIRGFTHPPVVLFGVDGDDTIGPALLVTRSVLDPTAQTSVHSMNIPSAELAKVALNTWFTIQINYANALAPICDFVGANVDDVTALITGVTVNTMRAGLGDGGPCRPRDAIAMRTLTDGIVPPNADPFEWATVAREASNDRMAQIAFGASRELDLPIFLLGVAYKRGVNYTFASPALQLAHLLGLPPYHDPRVPAVEPVTGETYTSQPIPDTPHLFIYGVADHHWASLVLPPGSAVLDPWGIAHPRPGIRLLQPGRGGDHGDV